MRSLARCCVLCLGFFASNAFAPEKSDEPHEHQGILKPYQSEPPELTLTPALKQSLEAGEVVYLRQAIDDAERGVAVFRVNAPVQTVWSVIRNFRSYPQWIDDIDEVEIYLVRDDFIFVRFTAGGAFGKTTWYVEHEYPRDDRNWGSWRLDYDYRSDIDDSVGYWRVTPVIGQDNVSEVVYSADLRLSGFIASLFEESLIDSSLKDASIWVKREAESISANQ